MNFKEWFDISEAANMMKGFRGWYNHSRGNWADVQAAAHKDPAVRAILQRIHDNLDNLSNAGPWGDQLEAAVEKHFPDHSKQKARDQWEKDRFASLGVKSTPQASQNYTRTATNSAGSDGYNLRQDPTRKDISQTPDETQISRIVTDHERRLRNLETFLKGQQNVRGHTVGAMDATASYHR